MRSLHLDKSVKILYNIGNDNIRKAVKELAETEFKHGLRERRKEFNEFLELIEKENIDELKKKLQAEIDVITETLGD